MSLENKKQNNQDNESSFLCNQVLDRIENEQIKPCPRWQFWCRYNGIWVLWGISVVLGAVSVAVMLYVVEHVRFAFYEATHDTPFLFFVEVLPYIWIVTFILLSVIAYYNFRHTKRGYRYPLWQVVGSSLFFSLVGGLVLNYIGIGYLIDSSLARSMPTYPSLERMEMKMWQMPEEGRLVVRYKDMTDDNMFYQVVDTNGQLWKVDAMELQEPDTNLLILGKSVRIIGTTTDFAERRFHACGVFPWMFDQRYRAESLASERREFVEKMYKHMENKDRLESLEEEIFELKTYEKPFAKGLCADLAMMRRFGF